jgi:hypothetical protein
MDGSAKAVFGTIELLCLKFVLTLRQQRIPLAIKGRRAERKDRRGNDSNYDLD